MERDEKIFFNLPLNKEYYKIEISDNGIGFNQVNAEKIFEPFVRLHSKSEYEGSGLGFPSVKKLQTIMMGSFMQKERKIKVHDLH